MPAPVDAATTDEVDIFLTTALGAHAMLLSRTVVDLLCDDVGDAPVRLSHKRRESVENLLHLSGYADMAALRADGCHALRATPAVGAR